MILPAVCVDSGVTTARQARSQHRHELRSLTYVTLDQANGGVVRNLTHTGLGVQAVAAVRAGQQLRLRFDLRDPRLRVEARGEVLWATRSGRCGIRFLDLPRKLNRQIDEWIFTDLLENGLLENGMPEGISVHAGQSLPMFAGPMFAEPDVAQTNVNLREISNVQNPGVAPVAGDGLVLSAAPLTVIELPPRHDLKPASIATRETQAATRDVSELDWLSQPLSRRGLAWTINVLVVLAALLLSTLTFLSVTHQAPRWPLATLAGAAILLSVIYWGFFRIFGGGVSLGTRLARQAGLRMDEAAEEDSRFR